MKVHFQTADKVDLQGQIIKSDAPKGVVLLNPGTATNTNFYIPFANFLAEQGYHVFLWNYRGFCESKTRSLARSPFVFSDIGRFDIPAAISKARSLFGDLPLFCIGHSAGGQQFALAHNHTEVKALIAVAVSAGYFPYMPLSYRLKAYFFFRCFIPVTSALFHYVPAKRFQFMEDLPTGLAKEWGEWCKEKELFFSDKFYGKSIPQGACKDVDLPIHVFTADDDEICTERNVNNFWKNWYNKQEIHYTRYQSAQLNKGSIGHFGYFRKKHQSIWQDIVNTLNAF